MKKVEEKNIKYNFINSKELINIWNKSIKSLELIIKGIRPPEPEGPRPGTEPVKPKDIYKIINKLRKTGSDYIKQSSKSI